MQGFTEGHFPHGCTDGHGRTIVLDVMTEWCTLCAMAAPDIASCANDLDGQGVSFISLMHENSAAEPPAIVDLQEWIVTYGASYAVVADGDRVTAEYQTKALYPAYVLVGPDMTIEAFLPSPFDCSDVESILYALP